MDELFPEEQARRAIVHVLARIRDHEVVGYYMGLGSQSFDLLTEAYASLTHIAVQDVRLQFQCKKPQPESKQQDRGQIGVLADLLENAVAYCRMVDTCNDDALDGLIDRAENAIRVVRLAQMEN
jgi:signal transduction histidine kinase